MNIDMQVVSEFLMLVLSALVTAFVPVIALALRNYLVARQEEVKAYIPESVLGQIDFIADLVVAAAEQSGLTNELLREGAAKKEWAMNLGEAWLKENLGLMLDLDKLGDTFWDAVIEGLGAAIEAKVAGMNAERLRPS